MGVVIVFINGVLVVIILDSLFIIVKVDGNNNSLILNYLLVSNFDVWYWNVFDLYFLLFFLMEDIVFKVIY